MEDDEVEDDEVEDNYVKGKKRMMLRMMMWRRRRWWYWGGGGGPITRPPRPVCAACASEMHLDMSQEPLLYLLLYGNLQEKCRGPDWAQNAGTHFARTCAVEMHIRRATLYGNLQEKCRGRDWAQNADTHFVSTCLHYVSCVAMAGAAGTRDAK